MLPPLLNHLSQHLVPPGSLQNSNIVLPLALPNLAADFHTLGKQMNQIVIHHVNLRTQLIDGLTISNVGCVRIPDYQLVLQQILKVSRSELLLGIAQSAGRIAVALNHKPLKSKVHSPL